MFWRLPAILLHRRWLDVLAVDVLLMKLHRDVLAASLLFITLFRMTGSSGPEDGRVLLEEGADLIQG